MTIRLVIVGTGTGVGKTHVACALLRAWAARGESVIGLKPIETGLGPRRDLEGRLGGSGVASGGPVDGPSETTSRAMPLKTSSGTVLLETTSSPVPVEAGVPAAATWGAVPLATTSKAIGHESALSAVPLEVSGTTSASQLVFGTPRGSVLAAMESSRAGLAGDQDRLWRATQAYSSESTFHVKRDSAFHVKRPLYEFEDPVSPHLAAQRAGIRIDLAAVRRWVLEHSRAVTIIETAGGLFTPLDRDVTNFDLVAALLPACVLLVAPDRLGVLHDVTATLGLARALRRAPDGLLLSAPEFPDASTGQNEPALVSLGIAKAVASFPRAYDDDAASIASAHRVLDWLASRLLPPC